MTRAAQVLQSLALSGALVGVGLIHPLWGLSCHHRPSVAHCAMLSSLALNLGSSCLTASRVLGLQLCALQAGSSRFLVSN